MTWGIIATWRMALDGVVRAAAHLQNGHPSPDAVEMAVKMVEDCPEYRSVGYGGLPNEDCQVELDAAFMDGGTLSIGAVAGIRDYRNPVSIARRLTEERCNSFLVGPGAEEYAHRMGFERMNMLTEAARSAWKEKKEAEQRRPLRPYDGHDTVGVIGLDGEGGMTAATSTSGLFMKRHGRVGDSPLAGAGFYADNAIGAAAATGLGEDIMKGCLSYEVVRLMGEGHHPQRAAEAAVHALHDRLMERRGEAGDLSVICMNCQGEWGVGTNIGKFSFVVATDREEPAVYIASCSDGRTTYRKATQEWIDTHTE